MRGDFKSGRVKDPSAPINSKHEKVIKTFVKDYMEKAVKKKIEREKGRASRPGSKTTETKSPETPLATDEMLGLSDTEQQKSQDTSPTDASALELKRKREGDDSPGSPKKSRTEMPPAPPPPPPPPPIEDVADLDGSTLTPIDDEAHSSISSSAKDANAAVTDGHPRFNPMDAVQLATPPTNGMSNHAECGHDRRTATKPSLEVQSGL